MKNKMYLIILMISLLLCSCSQQPGCNDPADTAPTQTNPKETEITANIIFDFTKYAALFGQSAEERNWIYFSTGCTFSKPEEIDLSMLFYLGVDHQGSWPNISEESAQHLISSGFMSEMDIQIMPVSMLQQILQKTFGTSLSDMVIPYEWEYIQAEDAYCSNHNDAFVPELHKIKGITEYSDGTVEITYTVSSFYDNSTGQFYENPVLVLKLKQTSADTWLVLSNTFG